MTSLERVTVDVLDDETILPLIQCETAAIPTISERFMAFSIYGCEAIHSMVLEARRSNAVIARRR